MSLQVSALETQCFSFFRVQLAALHSRRTCGAVGTAHKMLAELWSSPTDTSLFALFANGLEETMRTFTIANDRRQHVFCTHFKTNTIIHNRWHISNVLTAYNSAVDNECAEEICHTLCAAMQDLCIYAKTEIVRTSDYKTLTYPLRNLETRQLTSSLPTLNADNAGWIENC
jgi:hypothetical protein